MFEEIIRKYPRVDAALVNSQLQGITSGYEAARIVGNITRHPEYSRLAAALCHAHNKEIAPKSIREYISVYSKFLCEEYKSFLLKHESEIDELIANSSCDKYNWFSYNTLFHSYCVSINEYRELPEHVFLRVAWQLCGDRKDFKQVFDDLNEGYYNHASPTYFNSATNKSQLASCFIMSMEDNLDSILNNFYYSGKFSASCGGIGIDLTALRTSEINQIGKASGVVPCAKSFGMQKAYLNQGGRREGAGTLSCAIWHADIERFIDMKRNNLEHADNVRDIKDKISNVYTSVTTNNVFWKRVKEDGYWSMFDPHHASILKDKAGHEFEKAYIECENNPQLDKYKYVVKARTLLDMIGAAQVDCGMPFVKNIDAVNMKSNQQNLGFIRCSNLCQEIDLFTGPNDIGVCILGNMILNKYVTGRLALEKCTDTQSISTELRRCYDFTLLGEKVRQMVVNLNNLIDKNWYPTDEKRSKHDIIAKINEMSTLVHGAPVMTATEDDKNEIINIPSIPNLTNQRNRPIGIGVCAFADALFELDTYYESDVAFVFNKMVFACIYYNSLVQSVELAKIHGAYENFKGSPFSKGLLQFDLWRLEYETSNYTYNPNVRKPEDDIPVDPSVWGQDGTWEQLKRDIVEFGTRNSLLTAEMPTASTAQMRGVCESTETLQSNLFAKRTQNGTVALLNKHLIRDLEEIGIHKEDEDFVEYLLDNEGKIDNLSIHDDCPERQERLAYIKKKYKAIKSLNFMTVLKMAAARARYIDQSQSLNLYFEKDSRESIKYMRYGQELGLKTLAYYVRAKIKPTKNIKTISSVVDDSNALLPKEIPKVVMPYEEDHRRDEKEQEREREQRLECFLGSSSGCRHCE